MAIPATTNRLFTDPSSPADYPEYLLRDALNPRISDEERGKLCEQLVKEGEKTVEKWLPLIFETLQRERPEHPFLKSPAYQAAERLFFSLLRKGGVIEEAVMGEVKGMKSDTLVTRSHQLSLLRHLPKDRATEWVPTAIQAVLKQEEEIFDDRSILVHTSMFLCLEELVKNHFIGNEKLLTEAVMKFPFPPATHSSRHEFGSMSSFHIRDCKLQLLSHLLWSDETEWVSAGIPVILSVCKSLPTGTNEYDDRALHCLSRLAGKYLERGREGIISTVVNLSSNIKPSEKLSAFLPLLKQGVKECAPAAVELVLEVLVRGDSRDALPCLQQLIENYFEDYKEPLIHALKLLPSDPGQSDIQITKLQLCRLLLKRGVKKCVPIAMKAIRTNTGTKDKGAGGPAAACLEVLIEKYFGENKDEIRQIVLFQEFPEQTQLAFLTQLLQRGDKACFSEAVQLAVEACKKDHPAQAVFPCLEELIKLVPKDKGLTRALGYLDLCETPSVQERSQALRKQLEANRALVDAQTVT